MIGKIIFKLRSSVLICAVLVFCFNSNAEDVISKWDFTITIEGNEVSGFPIGFVAASPETELFESIDSNPIGKVGDLVSADWKSLHWNYPAYLVHHKYYDELKIEGGSLKVSDGEFFPWNNLGIGYVALASELDTMDNQKPPVIEVFNDSKNTVIGTMRDLAVPSPSATKYSDERIIFEHIGDWMRIGPEQWVKIDNKIITWREHYQVKELTTKAGQYEALISIVDQALMSNYDNSLEDYSGEPIWTKGKYLHILKTEGDYALVVLTDDPSSFSPCMAPAPKGPVGWIRYVDDTGIPLVYGQTILC